MPEQPPDRDELLKDSEATLREVARILSELRDLNESEVSDPFGVSLGSRASNLASPCEDLPQGIRWGIEELKAIQVQIREGLVRASPILDRLFGPEVDGLASVPPEGELRRALAGELREEIRRMISLLRTHDQAAKELAKAANALAETD